MHILPDLKYLEHKYPNELVVIGCHSAKFDNEKDSDNIRKAIMRYEIEHPVINDSQMRIWSRLGVSSWPTVMVIDAEGNFCDYAAGEGNRDNLDDLIGKLVKYHKANGTLDETPIRFDLERNKLEPKPLRFPGKLLTDEPGNRLFISDSNNNRIVVSTLDGQLIEVIGAGSIGAEDGSFDQAQFDHPQGMALVDEKLYVCDTENHLLRVADLKTKTVTTLAGTGEQARQRIFNWKLKSTALNSPWDVIHVNGWLYIAMAGPHQLWSHHIGSSTIHIYAGTGMEDIQNGTLEDSAFAQPSGLATDGKFLYVCDSEGSAIRRVSITTKGPGEVTTVVGTSNLPRGASLFAFGDEDGVGSKARLQHPLGVAYDQGALYVADSYNHKIRRITLSGQQCITWLGDGKSGDRLKPTPELAEPAGVAIAKGLLYVADTNNHRILTVDLKTKATKELTIAGLSPPKNRLASEDAFPKDVPANKVAEQTIRAGENLVFKISLQLPEGYKINPLYPASFRMHAEEGQTLLPPAEIGGKIKVSLEDKTATITVPLTGQTGKSPLQVALTYGYCREGKGGLCKVSTTRWNLPLAVAKNAQDSEIRLSVPVE
jgi:DNA-binding beta-propeller fold protein YncE